MGKDLSKEAVKAFGANDTGTLGMGINIVSVAPGKIGAEMTLTKDHLNGHGTGHGGVIYFLAVAAFGYCANTRNRLGYGHTGSITYVAPVHPGDHLTALATEIHATGRTATIDVTVTNQNDEIVAIFRGGAHLSKDLWIKES